MTIWQAFILSLVEGITEFLPISSTGHLILVSNWLAITQTEFAKSFDIIIQLGAIAAVAVLYAKRLISNRSLLKPVLVAFIPTAVVGFLLYKSVKLYLLGNPLIPAIALFVGGILLILFEKFVKTQKPELSLSTIPVWKAVVIGLAQSVALIPGVSRSAATIVAAMWLGVSKTEAVEFSFLLSIPTIAAATGLDIIKSPAIFTSSNILLLVVGFVGSFITALIAVKGFLRFVSHHSFVAFGIYRIIIAVVFFASFWGRGL